MKRMRETLGIERVCRVCKRSKPVRLIHINQKTGQVTCKACYTLYFQPKEPCTLCGKIRRVALWKDGKSICNACYQKEFQSKKKCSRCGKEKIVQVRKDGPICPSCRHREKIGICKDCGERKVIQALGRCYGCYQRQRRAKMASPA